MTIAPEDLGNINEAPDSGTPTRDMKFAVQQANAGDTLQAISFHQLAYDDDPSIGGENSYQFITPDDFKAGTSLEGVAGIIAGASDAEIVAGTAYRALTCNKQTELFNENARQVGTVNQSEIDANTEGTVTLIDLRGFRVGKMVSLTGYFTFVPDSDSRSKNIYITNIALPVFRQAGCGFFTDDVEPISEKPPISVSVAKVSTALQLTIGTPQENINWNNARTYTVHVNVWYLAE